MWDLSSSTRDQTLITCIERRILNHWSTKEVPKLVIDLTWIITMPALGPGLSLTSRYLLQGQVNLHKAQLQSVSPLLNAFWILCCVFQCHPVELSSVMEMFYAVQYGNHHHMWL